MELFFVSVLTDREEKLTLAANSLLSDSKRDRLHRCKNAQLRTGMVAGELLLAYALFKERALRYCGHDRFEDENGKPLLRTAGVDTHFSISHSGSYAMVGVAHEKIGVDVQKHVRVDNRVAQKVMPEQVYQEWRTSKDRNLFFCEFWACLESVLKWRGVGIAGLEEQSLPLSDGVVSRLVAAPKGFSAAACGSGVARVHSISADQLIRFQDE